MFKIWFKRRPDINSQNTGHEAFQRPMGLAENWYKGGAGFVIGNLNATNPATVVPGNSLVKRDPTVTGNPSRSPTLDPLSQDRLTQILTSMGG